MGCACTRAANGEKSRNDSSQSESAKKYTKEDSGGFGPSHGGGGGDRGATGGDVGSEAHKAPLIADEAQSAPAAPSGPGSGGKQHGPMSKFISNIFDRKKTISSDQDGSSSHLLSSRIASPNTPLLDVSHDRSMPSLIDMKSHSGGTAATTSANTTTTSGVGVGVGATAQRGGGGGRLPQNTLNLICGLSELERKPTSMEQAALAASSSSHVSSNKLNREIQSYMSLPYTDGARSLIPPANADATVIYTLKFIERHLNSTEPIDASSDSTSVYDSLRQYCAQKTRNCDFTLVNLNYYASAAATTGSFSSSSPSRTAALSSSAAAAAAASATNPGSSLAGAFHLAANKYFRRALTRLILSDLVNNNYISTPTSPIDVGFKRNVNYMAPNGLFIIFLSEPQIEQESVDDLLCPERIDLADFKSHLEKKISKHDHELFSKWYKPVESADGGAYYRLDIDFNAAASTHAQKSLNEELGKLTRILYAHLDDGSETTEHHGASSLRLKYLKSVQQDELELISRHADANMIIWIHLVGAPSTASTDHDRLNKARYALIFDLLKDKVLNHNYKQIRIGMVDSASENFSLRQHLTAVNEFLFNSIKLLVDAVTLDLDKSAISMMAIRMDKHLGLEITKHYNYYKYLRLCSPAPASTPSSTGAIATSTVLQQVENKLTTILNDYLSESNSRTPLMIYNSDTNTGVSGVGDETASSYFDRFTSKWIGRLIETNSKTNADYKKLIVYRFCNHTILASEVLTLLQSIAHQLCFILSVHESLAFESPAKIVENLSKSLGKFFSKNENKQKQIVIVLNGLDRCLKTPYDVNLVVSFVNKIFGAETWPIGSVKLVMTLSINSPTSMSTQKLVASLQKKLDSQFTQKPTCKLNFDAGSRRSSLAAATSVLAGATASSWPSLNDHLTSLLFGSAPAGSGATNDNLAHQLVDLLVYFLSETRYGVKQSEIGDLFRTAVAAANGNAMSQLDPALRSYMLDTAWFTMKYYGRLFASSACTVPPSLITLCTDQSQALFKLAVANLGTSYQPRKATKSSKIDEIIYSYYNRSVSSNTGKAATLEAEKALLRYVSHFNTRIFHELPKCFYLSDSADPQEDQAYINEFILNPKWLLNKSYTCMSVLYYLHDLVSYRKLFMAGSSADSEIDEAASSPTDATAPAFTAEEVANMSSKKKFVRFEKVVYKCLFNLSQDHNQLGYFVKSLGVEPLLTNANYLAVKAGNAPRLLPLNFSYFKLKDDAKSTCLLEQDNRELVYFTKVVFIQRGIFLTLSDAPYNLIKIWKVEQNEPIRTIKLNKSPKDIRLINHHTGIVLIERNLHLIDLNMCEHIYDLNSTMNPSFALFELHDYNHLVLLARNRLSVILMKVPHITTTSSSSGETTDSRKNSIVPVSPPPIETNPAVGGKLTVAKDDMFLFKVGEDRYLKSLVVSRNGKIMVCGDEVQKPFPLLVWNLNQRKLVYDLRQPNHEIIVSVQAISSSGRFFVSACQEEGETKNCLIVYDLSTGQLFKKLKAKSDYICVDVSEECDVIISGLDNSQIVVYDLSTGSKRFSINSNKYPINKIKLVDAWNKQLKNYFLTYDTTGSDWTIRLWDLQAGDQLISSITMPARLISLDINTSPYYLEQSTATTITPTATPTPTPQPPPQPANNEQIDHEILLAVSVYGVRDALLVKLDVPNAKAIYQVKASHEHFSNNDAALNALVKEINL